ncbi:MAG: DUF98 domain-containing protein [Ramlibacter sp.]|nr:DUF98 domain-containing protein [Ramlibacter sp.]
MSLVIQRPLARQRFHDLSDSIEQAAHAQGMLQLLLTQDGSTTRLCEAIAQGPVSLHLIEQQIVDVVPDPVRSQLVGASFIERITCLSAHGKVLMDNLSYIALDGLAADLRRDLEDGVMPFGHMLPRLWSRRTFYETAPMLHARLWDVSGLPDPDASRTYCLSTPEGPCMVIAETFRRGMLMAHDRRGALPHVQPTIH